MLLYRRGKLKIENIPKAENFKFSSNTTYGLGGGALAAYFPESISQAVAVYDYLKENDIKSVVLGNGSNILASDTYFDGAVIVTKRLKEIIVTSDGAVFCRAGVTVASLLKYCVENGLTGLEYLAGIPATIGGIVYMNGGAGGKYVDGNVLNVEFYDGKIRNLSNKQCRFGAKYSIMRDVNGLILGVWLNLTPETPEKVRENINCYLNDRKGLPKGKSCGCVFKNPDGYSAGKLIDEAGLKGMKIGGAEVSSKHANFILNNGASSSDVYRLIKAVKNKVSETTGITLEEEVVYIGEF